MRAKTPAGLMALALASFGVVTGARAQDVMKAAPEHYKVLVENEQVRVVENTLAPGEKDDWHTHPAGWYYVTQPGTMKVVFADGREVMWEPAAGESGWSPPEAAHTSENVGASGMSYILVELKPTKAARAAARRPAGRGGH